MKTNQFVPAPQTSSSRGRLHAAVCQSLEPRILFSSDTWLGLATGLLSTKWSTGLNWGNLSQPSNGQDVTLGGILNPVNINDISGLSLKSITYSAGSFSSDGNQITLQSGGGGITVGSGATGSDELDTPLALASSQTFTVTNAASNLLLGGVISGSGSAVTKAGAGTLTLSGANTWGGFTTISAGTLVDGAVGVIPDGSAVTVASGATFNLNGNSETIGSLSGAGSVILGAATLTAGGDNTSTTFTGNISGTGGLTKAGTGSLFLNSTNALTGTTSVTAGTLGGTGSVAGPLSVASGGTLTPGTTGTGLFSSGNLTMASGATFSVALNGTTAGSTYGQLAVTGTVALGGATLNVSSSFAASIGTTFKIISNDGTADAVTGTFNGLAEGGLLTVGSQQFQISYHGGDGNDVVLTKVNSAPVINAGSPSLTAVNENDSASSGTLISTLISSAGAGFITDADSGAATGIAITGADTTNGSWQYSTNNGSTWTALGTPSTSSARLLASDTSTRVRFVPATNFRGTISAALTFSAWDQTSGSNGATASVTTNGGLTAFSSGSANASLVVNAINQAPVLTVPGAQSVNEDTALSLSGISVSDVDASGGTETLTLSVTHGTLTFGSSTGLTYLSGASGTSSLSVSGTLANLNADLATLNYQGVANYNGSDLLSASLNDQGNSGSGGALSNAHTVAITINAVNDAPVLAGAGTQTVAQDGTLSVPGIVVSDVDANGASETLTLSVSHGTLTLGSTSGLTLASGANGSAAMSYTGTLAALNAAMATLSYAPSTHYNGADSLSVVANDQGNTGSGGALTASEAITINVSAVNLPPTITVPGAQGVNEESTLPISGISVGDTDAAGGSEVLTLSVAEGTLTFASTSGLAFLVGSNGSGTISVSGTIANLNAAVGSLTYAPATGYFGTDSLALLINDQGNTGSGGALTANGSVAITVAQVNHAPVLSVPGAQNTDEDTSLVLAGISLSDSDGGAGTETINLSVGNGTLTLAGTTGLTFGSGTNGSSIMTFSGTVADIDAALAIVTYQPNANFNGSDTVQIGVNDQGNTGLGGALTDAKTIAVTVNAVNDPPVITAPATAGLDEDTPLNLTGISLSDVDGGAGVEEMALSVSHGTLTLASTSGLTFASGANASGAMSVTGTIADIDTALASVTYTPSANYNGADIVVLNANDQGNTGAGGPADAAPKSIALTIQAVNDAPVLTLPGGQSMSQDGTLALSGISVSDVDGGSGVEEISISVAHGLLTLGSTTGLTVEAGANGSSLITADGTLANLNAALATLSYSPSLHYHGSDTISLSINDLGNTGAGGALTSSGTIAVSISQVNLAPTLTAPTTLSLNEDDSASVSGVTLSDIDGGVGSIEQVQLTANHGVLTLGASTGLTIVSGANGSASLTVSGTLPDLNTDLATLSYQPVANYNGSDTIAIVGNDLGNTGSGGALTASASVAVSIAAVNDAPVLTLPGTQTLAENVASSISGISVSDVDGAGSESLTLSVGHGTLTFGSTTGLTISAGANGSAAITVTGSLASLNAALGTLVEQGAAGYFGADQLNVTINDLGNTGLGGPLSANGSIQLNIGQVNQPPTIVAPSGVSMLQDGAMPVSGIYLADVDANGSVEQLTLGVSHGTLTLGSTAGLTINTGSNGSSALSMTGTLADLNTALATMTYRPSPGYRGADSISVAINDLGHNGAGGSQGASASVPVTIGAKNAAPTVTLPASPSTQAGQALAITGISVNDVDSGSGAEQLVLAVQHGTLSLTTTTGLTFVSGANGSRAMVITGTLTNLNAALATLQYTSTAGYNATDSLTVSINDLGHSGAGGPLSATGVLSIAVSGGVSPSLVRLDDFVPDVQPAPVLTNDSSVHAVDITDSGGSGPGAIVAPRVIATVQKNADTSVSRRGATQDISISTLGKSLKKQADDDSRSPRRPMGLGEGARLASALNRSTGGDDEGSTLAQHQHLKKKAVQSMSAITAQIKSNESAFPLSGLSSSVYGVSITFGWIFWYLRGGAALSGLMALSPVLRPLDPLAVLTQSNAPAMTPESADDDPAEQRVRELMD